MSFENFCIVCDRLILPPKEVEQVKTAKKKPAAGTIRVSRDGFQQRVAPR
jgi:hypothetical protein